MIGIYQANVVIPPNLPADDYPLVITVAGSPSAPALISVGGN